MADPWERREGESSKAFHAFCCYRDQGPKRSMLAAYVLYSEADTGKKRTGAPGFIRKWADDFAWNERAHAFDKSLHDREMALLRQHREDHVVTLWRGMRIALEKQMAQMEGAGFDEITRLYNSMRSSIQAFDSELETDDVPGAIEAGREPPTYTDPWLEAGES